MRRALPLTLVLALGLTAVVSHLTRNHQAPAAKPTATVAAVAPTPWPHAASDIKPDPRATFGSLPNGLRYIIVPNSEPPKRVSLRLHIASGSLMEADNQQGLAHFMEHMVFNGSKNFAAAELVPRMQRLGIGFGAHVNAFTSFDETVYMLDLPDLSDDTMNLCFNVMRDFADGAKLEPAEIDRERGVILSEMTSRDSVQYRLMKQQFATLLPDSLLAKRFPLGTEEVIKTAPRERFTDYYSRYYTPARMTFVVVGNIAPDVLKTRIEKTFASLTNPATPGKDPILGPITETKGLQPAVFTDKEVAATDLSLLLTRPHVHKPDTVANRIARMQLDLAHAMIDRRFERLAKKNGSPITTGNAERQELFNYLDIGSIEVTAANDRWQEALPVLEQEFRRALEHGFNQAELDEAKANLLNSLEQEVKRAPTRASDGFASAIARTLNEDSVLTAPETDLDVGKQGLAAATVESCHAALKEFWANTGLHLVLTTKEKPADAEKTLEAIYQKSRSQKVAPLEEAATAAFAYSSFGTPGTVAQRKEEADLTISSLVLSNGVHVNLKSTDFEKNTIRLVARVGSGKLTHPTDAPGLGKFTQAIFDAGGLGKHSVDELERILAGRNVDSSFGIASDAFTFSGKTTPDDLQLELQLMCAQITDPGWREEAVRQYQKELPTIYQQLKHTPAGAEQDMDSWLHGGDPRFTMPPIETMLAYQAADASNWIGPALANGYLELSIVGDFQQDQALPLILATFGALPKRESSKPELADARVINFPQAPAEKDIAYESKIPLGVAFTGWKTFGLRGKQKDYRRLNLLAAILSDRLREEIRQKLGASYSPEAGAEGDEAFDIGFIAAISEGKPTDIAKLAGISRDLAASIARKGATADELDRARKPVLAELDKSLRDNRYWLSTVMSQCQENPDKLELARNRGTDYRSITLKEVNTLAKKYFATDNALRVQIVPKGE